VAESSATFSKVRNYKAGRATLPAGTPR
jgi:hypothetical protein